MYDKKCTMCRREEIDVWEPVHQEIHACTCGGSMERAWLGKASSVIADDIPGGLEIKHALCNSDGTPRRYYSKSEIAKEAKKRGYENYVVHHGTKDGDKSKHTSRWV